MEQATIDIIYALFMFVTGTLFGSFFSLATYRIPRKEDILVKRSYCPNCKHRLGFFDCFPILSYISTIGRCRYCLKGISPRYIIMELISGFVFLILYLIVGFSSQLFILLACYIYLFLIIGSSIMESNMTEEEKKEVQANIEDKRNKKKENKEIKASKNRDKRTGAINIEVLVAMIIFVFYFASTLFIMRNYSSTLIEYKRKSDALNVCLNQMNTSKSANFDDLISATGNEEIDGYSYEYDVSVSTLLKEGYVEVPNAKEIVVTVNYYLQGELNTTTLKSIKVESAI